MDATRAAAVSIARRLVGQPETLGDGDCEALRAGLLGQPVNTVTSLGYVVGGAWLLTRVQRIQPEQRPAATAYAVSAALSGAGSVAYHGPQFAGAQLLHDLPIVAMVGLGIGVPVARLIRRTPVLRSPSRGFALGAVGLVVVSALSYVGGRTGAASCRPESVIQLHGLWHLGTAAAATMWAVAIWPTNSPEAAAGEAVAGETGARDG